VLLLSGVAIAIHFSLILLQATPLNAWLAAAPAFDPLFAVARYYRGISFANRNFRFFAPAVADDLRLSIRLADAEGNQREHHFEDASRELQLAARAMLDHASDSADRMEEFARAWADHAMRAQPDVTAATVQIYRVLVPSMAQYRAGQRMQEQLVYARRFEHAPRPRPRAEAASR
jgi:hypothetical protein